MIDKEIIIDANDLSVQINERFILQHLNLQVYKGEILAIVGGSGSGKTTLMRSILKLTPATGSIKVFDKQILNSHEEELALVRRNWGVMFQQGALFSSLTVLENIAYPLTEYTKLDTQTINEIARLKLALVGLKPNAADLKPAELSGGMKKRAAIARAIALDPKLLFLDEPTAGLDPDGADSLDELILQLNETLGLTVFMVTHDLDTLWKVTHRVAFLGDGKIQDVNPMADLIHSKVPMVQDYFANERAKVRTKVS